MKPKQPKHQRIKIAILPFLLGVLAYVLWAPTSPEQNSGLVSPTDAPPSPQASMLTVQPAAPTVPAVPGWPEVDLKFLLQSNPMSSQNLSREARAEHLTSFTGNHPITTPNDSSGSAPIPAATDAESSPVQHLLQNLADSQVNYVFKSNRHQAVMIGDQLYQQGDQFTNSLQLHAIQNNALVLKESRQPPSIDGWIRQLNAWAHNLGWIED